MNISPTAVSRNLLIRTLLAVGLIAAALGGSIAAPRAIGSVAAAAKPKCLWMNRSQSPDTRARELLAHMTLNDKILMVHGGASGTGTGNVAGNPALCIPALHLNDGPEGVGNSNTGVTAFPAPMGMASSWNPALLRQVGRVDGLEHWRKGSNVWLGPGMNIARVPMNGRTFEYFGEDPYLAGQMAVAEIRGAQYGNPKEPVVATAKHYMLNNQEDGRNAFSMDASPRTIHEIYLPAFEASVRQANVGAVMCSYNRIWSVYACEKRQTLLDYLKHELGFKGWVMSDWLATHSTVAAANNGLDMEMPGSTYFGSALKTAVQNHQVPMSRLNDMVFRIIRTMFRIGLFDYPPPAPVANVSTPADQSVAKKASEEGSVLLKNAGGLLPLAKHGLKIAVIGPTASNSTTSGINANNVCTGQGSAAVTCSPVTPLAAITARAKKNKDTVTFDDGNTIASAVAAAKQADVAIVFGYYIETEGADLPALTLQGNGNALIAAVAAANPNTAVVLNTGGPALMPWLGSVKSVLEMWYPGVQDGNSASALLFGDVDPSGRLAQTFPASPTQMPASTPQQYPGVPGKDGNVHAVYSEGLLVGYRWYEAKHQKPLFCFGDGLSYTSFRFGNLKLRKAGKGSVAVSFQLKNTGKRGGMETGQVYVGDPKAAGEPPQQLKADAKLYLKPGQVKTVTVMLNPRSFSYWSASKGWTVAPGTYRVMVGGSSCSISLTKTLTF